MSILFEKNLKDQSDRIQYVPMDTIYVDQVFNCRGAGGVQALDVISLSENIKANGLLQPIIIRIKNSDEIANPVYDKFEHFIVAGFRRYMACKMAGFKEIKCIVKTNLTRSEAFLLNLSENLSRKQMTMDQEAYAIDNLMKEGLSREQIAKKLGMSVAWVNVRCLLLTLPTEIREIAKTNVLNTHHIQAISRIKDPAKQIEKANEIKSLVEDKGVRKSNIRLDKPKEGAYKARKRNPSEIDTLITFLLKHFGTCLATRALAWANGNLDNKALWETMITEAKIHGKVVSPTEDYSIPSDDIVS